MSNAPAEKKRLIAIVDDHDPFRTGVCRLLERHGYATCDFASVAPFIKSKAMMRIDCLILDVGLPEIDGLALQECIRHTNYQFPIIFCTGQEMDDRLQKALSTGTSVLLRKPVKAEILIDAVSTACAAGARKN